MYWADPTKLGGMSKRCKDRVEQKNRTKEGKRWTLRWSIRRTLPNPLCRKAGSNRRRFLIHKCSSPSSSFSSSLFFFLSIFTTQVVPDSFGVARPYHMHWWWDVVPVATSPCPNSTHPTKFPPPSCLNFAALPFSRSLNGRFRVAAVHPFELQKPGETETDALSSPKKPCHSLWQLQLDLHRACVPSPLYAKRRTTFQNLTPLAVPNEIPRQAHLGLF